MHSTTLLTRAARVLLGCSLALCLAGCGSPDASDTEVSTPEESVAAPAATLEDGVYDIEVETDSSMFRADSCQLTVADGSYAATLVLPGEGFSRLYFGSAEEAAEAADDQVFDYYLNDEGKYAFDIPVAALDEELPVAAFGHRRDTWYDHTIVFHAPALDASTEK